MRYVKHILQSNLASRVSNEAEVSQPGHATLEVVRFAIESTGCRFIDENGGGAGVRLRKPLPAPKRK